LEESGMASTDELRPVTTLFADIVGSTGLGERLAPDEVKAVVGECVTRMSHAVEEHGGTVQSYMGDGICAYFGVPTAHEDDPERAARAALRILAVVGEYGREVEAAFGISGFSVRVGVNSGQVAVGPVGAGSPQHVALGDTTNVAARLQAAAEPATILVGPLTARRLVHRFALEPRGQVAVKGREEPVEAFRLMREERGRQSRPRTKLVGRDAELARLEEVLSELAAGRGRVVVLSGADGIGKTRLLGELRARADDRAVWIEGGCVSHGAEVPFGPFVDALRRWLEVGEEDAELAVRARLRARLEALLGGLADEALPPLAQLLALRPEPGREVLSAEALRSRIAAASVALCEALAATSPVAIAVEDVQWLDPASRELLEALLALTDRAPVLVVLTLRPDPSSEGHRLRVAVLTDYAHRLVEIALEPLSLTESRELLLSLLPILDPEALDEIARRAEGNPFYLEQLLHALVEGSGFVRHRTWTIASSAVAELPPALEGLLVARIDRLEPSARRLAQVAAVCGRTFPLRVIEATGEVPDVTQAVAALLRAEVVVEERRFPELRYAFTHGLLQEAALSSLTQVRRRELHGEVAEANERVYAEALDEHLEELAYHYARSADRSRALDYLKRAASRAAALGDEDAAGRLKGRIAALET
jgi:class 3 adenylate cyclase